MRKSILAVIGLSLVSTFASAADSTGKYANSPWADWFGRQHNADGGYCCTNFDGHVYDGDYLLNADGSVTLPLKEGGAIEIPAGRVLQWNPEDPNPTGSAVLWYGGQALAATTFVYCFAVGPLI